MPGLSHAGPPPPVARHPRSGDGALGAHHLRAGRRRGLPARGLGLAQAHRDEHPHRPRLSHLRHAARGAAHRGDRPCGAGRGREPHRAHHRARGGPRSLAAVLRHAPEARGHGDARLSPASMRRPPGPLTVTSSPRRSRASSRSSPPGSRLRRDRSRERWRPRHHRSFSSPGTAPCHSIGARIRPPRSPSASTDRSAWPIGRPAATTRTSRPRRLSDSPTSGG